MKAKDLHDCLLSLLVRGLGLWLLFQAITGVYELILIPGLITSPGGKTLLLESDLEQFLFRLVVALYFMVGAPPFLKLATEARPPGGPPS